MSRVSHVAYHGVVSRFAGFPSHDGLLVLDTLTGEVVLVPYDGGEPRVRRRAIADATTIEPILAPVLAAEWVAAAPPAARSAFDAEVIATYPMPVAATYLRYLEEPDPRTRCRLLVETFTNLLKLWAFQVASEYLEAEGVRDPAVNESLARDFQRPLISAWNLALHRTLPALREGGVPLFAPDLALVYEQLESRCRDPFAVTLHYEDGAGNARTKQSRLGKITAFIKYRNSLAHGYSQTADRATEELERYGPLLVELLQAARFMTRCPLYRVVAAGPGPGSAVRLMGAHPSGEPETLPPGTYGSRFVLRDEASGRVLPLHVFVDAGADSDVLLFEGYTSHTIVYVSTRGERIERETTAVRWAELLARKAMPARVLAASSVSAEHLRAAADRRTVSTLQSMQASGRYLPEASVDRADAQEWLAQFEQGDFRGLVIAGESGGGKSTLIARYAERRRAAGDVVLFYRASLLTDTDLQARIVRDLGVRETYFEDLLTAIEHCVRGAGDGAPRLFVMVDGVNEFPADPAGLVRAIDALVAQAASYTWMRVAVTVRSAAYERLPPDARFGRVPDARYLEVEEQRGETVTRTPLMRLGPFPPEAVGELYERYRNYRQRDPQDPADEGVYVFRPLTAFADLAQDGSTRALFRNPLMLRLVLAAFHRRELPSQLSHDEAFGLYVAHVVVERDNPAGAFPQRLGFLRSLVAELDARSTDTVRREDLYKVDSLRAALQNPHRDSPYVQLLDLGILQEEWHDDQCWVRFAFDGFFEFLLAELHDQRIDTVVALVVRARRALGFRNLRGALVVVLRRACREGRVQLLADAVRDPSGEQDEQLGLLLRELAREALAHLARARDPSFDRALAAATASPARVVAQLLLDLFDQLFVIGETSAAQQCAELAAATCEALGWQAGVAAALLRLGNVQQQHGDSERALVTLADASRRALEADDPLQSHRIDVLRGRVHLLRSEFDLAAPLFDAAYAGLSAVGVPRDAADARRGQASVAGHRGDLAAKERLLADAYELSRQAGDQHGASKALNNLGMAYTQGGEFARAEDHFRRALAISESLGARGSIAIALMNLAGLAHLQGRGAAETRPLYERALRIFEELGHHQGVTVTVMELGVLAHSDGDIAQARELYGRALRLREQRGDAPGVVESLWSCVSAALDAGDRSSAEPLFARLARLAADAPSPTLAARVAALEVRLAARTRSSSALERALPRLEAMHASIGHPDWGTVFGIVASTIDGPASAYLDAAELLAHTGDAPAARRCLRAARSAVGTKRYHRVAELDALERSLGLQTTVEA